MNESQESQEADENPFAEIAKSNFKTALVSTAPGFIKNFFSASRLHHLSTWKSELIDFVCDKMNSSAKYVASSVDENPRVIMHIDMDCFFASVGIRDRPHLRDKPVAVAHSTGGMQTDFSSSEIASCNYEARKRGVKNGMFIGSAKDIAPDLVIIPYEFDKYNECTRKLYAILIDDCDFVQAVSCDEAYVDVSRAIRKRLQSEGLMTTPTKRKAAVFLDEENEENETGGWDSSRINIRVNQLSLQFAENLRVNIAKATGCNASVGIASNMLLARLATAKAKPNNKYFLSSSEALLMLNDLPVRELPGFGRATTQKCEQLHLMNCGDIRRKTAEYLQQELGEKTGATLYEYSLGRDNRQLENKPRQSLGADINWGIRFSNQQEIEIFLKEFSKEVFQRLDSSGWTASHLTINAKKRLYEGEPMKFLGCGNCQDFSRSENFSSFIPDEFFLYKHVSILYNELGINPTELRGIGIHLKKLKRKTAKDPIAKLFSASKQSSHIHVSTMSIEQLSSTTKLRGGEVIDLIEDCKGGNLVEREKPKARQSEISSFFSKTDATANATAGMQTAEYHSTAKMKALKGSSGILAFLKK